MRPAKTKFHERLVNIFYTGFPVKMSLTDLLDMLESARETLEESEEMCADERRRAIEDEQKAYTLQQKVTELENQLYAYQHPENTPDNQE